MDSMQSQLRTAQLTALQNQISPHFIVNSLDAIRMKLIMDGQEESAQLLHILQNSLKSYGFSPYETVTLSQEFAFLQDTLKLHRFRFLGNLTWHFHLPAELGSCEIPRFLLQPILENAVRHGLTPDMPNPCVQVEAYMQRDYLCLRVEDNGHGFVQSQTNRGIGLANVKERLKILYGESCELIMKPNSGSGVCVTLRLPGKGGAFL